MYKLKMETKTQGSLKVLIAFPEDNDLQHACSDSQLFLSPVPGDQQPFLSSMGFCMHVVYINSFKLINTYTNKFTVSK